MDQLDMAVEIGVESLGSRAGHRARRADRALVKWITANDAGVTGSHQAGFHLPKDVGSLFFARPGLDGVNMKQDVRIDWVGHEPTESVATWYGRGTRSEYRLTRLGAGFPYRGDEHVGSLLVMVAEDDERERFTAWVLATDTEIEDFLETTGLTPGDVGGLVDWDLAGDDCVQEAADLLAARGDGWPTTREMSAWARQIAQQCRGTRATDGDRALSTWVDVEYQLFRTFEDVEYARLLGGHDVIESVDELIRLALPFVNRRKSRAGASLEHHFGALLEAAGLPFSTQVRTEGSSTMDFVLPSGTAYQDPLYESRKIIAVGAKTSARERWRQILDEADGADHKFLLTLQPVSASALEQMLSRGLRVVVPNPLQRQFDRAARDMLLSIDEFVDVALDITTTA